MSSSSYRSSRHDRPYRNSGGGGRSNYHSPSSSRLSSGRYDGDRDGGSGRGRDRERDRDRYVPPAALDDYRGGASSGGTGCAGKCFSNFYRERFGSHSPEDYRNLRVSQFSRDLSKNEIRLLLEREFKSMAPFEIKIVRNPEDDERLAYVNFERDNCAKTIRRSLIPRLRNVLGERLVLDPTGVIRDQEGKYIPDRYNRAVMAAERRTPPLSTRAGRRRSYSPRSRSRSASPRRTSSRVAPPPQPQSSHRENSFNNLVQDDSCASRTLFVGNLPGDVRESELKRVFEIYGRINEIEIKNLSTSTCYAFILYQTVEEALEARRCQHNKPMRPGSTLCQIGYGKTQTSSRLYVGGLGSWTSAEMLMREFDRYGAIEELEYETGQSFAYIRFVDIDSACDACSRMRNFELKAGKFLTVDFAKSLIPRGVRKRPHSPSMFATADDVSNPRAWSPTSAGYISTLEELREQFACTWKGFVTLKKVDYPMAFHRVYGKEHLLQDNLRDESGAALKLNITQRLKLDTNYYQELLEVPAHELALMVAIDGTPSAERVVQYLQEKGASGQVVLDNCTVNIVPQSPISERLLNFFAPRISIMKMSPTYMLIVLRKPDVSAVAKVEALPPPPPLPSLTLAKSEPPIVEAADSSHGFQLNPPPPLPSLRVKTEMDDDRLEQLHQERMRLHTRVKHEASPVLQPAPLPPVLGPSPSKRRDGEAADSNGDAPMMMRIHRKRGDRPPRRRHQSDEDGDEDGDSAPAAKGASPRQYTNNDDISAQNGDVTTNNNGKEPVEASAKNIDDGDSDEAISPASDAREELLDDADSSDADPANIHLEE